jgi:predicted transposase YbfD/YdcC
VTCDPLAPRDRGAVRGAERKKSIVEEFLELLEAPRLERTRQHTVETIPVIALLAVVCGADSFVGIERFARAKQAWLATFLDVEDGVPSHDTIGRVFAALDPRALSGACQRWTLAMTQASQEKLVAIDGKTLRRSFRHAGDSAFVHMVSAWSASNRVVLGQVQTEESSNEIIAIPILLDRVDVRGALVTIDAAGTQVAIADKIVERGGDYLLAVKDNQPTLARALVEHFADAEPHADAGAFGFFETQERGHGRDERRRAWVSHAVGVIDPGGRWRGLAAVVRIETTRTLRGATTVKNRYFISSRTRLSAMDALEGARGHWSIENELHWVLDVAFREDDCQVRAGHAAASFSTVRQPALGVLGWRTEAKCGISSRRLMAGWDDAFLLRVVGLGGTKICTRLPWVPSLLDRTRGMQTRSDSGSASAAARGRLPGMWRGVWTCRSRVANRSTEASCPDDCPKAAAWAPPRLHVRMECRRAHRCRRTATERDPTFRCV